jgi:hypothetical protein
MLAEGVGEHFYNSALRDFSIVTLVNHSSELTLKPQQAADPHFDSFELIGGDAADLFARGLRHFLKSKHLPYGRDVKAEIPGMPDERQPSNILSSIKAPSALGAGWRRDEIDPLIVADRLDVHSCPLGQRSNGDHHGSISLGLWNLAQQRRAAGSGRWGIGTQLLQPEPGVAV